MPVVIPAGVKYEGNLKVIWVPTISSLAGPTVAELTATGALDISFFVTAGNFKPNAEQARGDDRRVGSKQTFQTLGRENPSIDDLVYIVDPQAAAATPSNKAYELFQQGVSGFIVARYGLDAETVDIAAAQKVDIYPMQFGVQNKTPQEADNEFAKITVTQPVAVIAPGVKRNIAVAA